ncbi:lactate racemase domain-containing protein [Pseudonocardia sp. ICBG1293]|uniref:lactate racemase domain-containing protein n=1 Tax=Pseudonocardia sp. ICBG1293 TaxID=2844382 RepID=UPI001CCFA131|nr:lactate racemase domain-containing protein [Pseudonocardia sp. ICBG1293]
MVNATRPVPTIGSADTVLDPDEAGAFVTEQLDALPAEGRSVCVVVPDGTRSCPLPLLIDRVHRSLAGRAREVVVLVALGTHQPMSPERLAAHIGCPGQSPETAFPGMTVRNHAWWDPDSLVSVGVVSADRVRELSEGRLSEAVDVRVNRHVVEADLALVVGPVFPHEVVGFSGGNKYFFPGVAGPEIIDLSHWLGALISSVEIIGTRGITPVRALIDEAAAMIPTERRALCLVVRSGTTDLHAMTFGEPEGAWAAAADVSAATHVRYLDAPVRRVVSVMPDKYEDIWTAAKGFYKLEPVVADGGEVVIVAPGIDTVSVTHPEIEEIGYHCRDYFTAQWERFRHVPWGVLAHSTHLRGAGTYDPVEGERARVRVTLATGIPRATVEAVDLGWADPAAVDLDAERADPTTLVVDPAGEILYRLRGPA